MIGAGLGVLLGVLGGASDCSEAHAYGTFCLEKDDAALGFSLILGLPSTLVGVLGGAATKTTDSYIFSESN